MFWVLGGGGDIENVAAFDIYHWQTDCTIASIYAHEEVLSVIVLFLIVHSMVG